MNDTRFSPHEPSARKNGQIDGFDPDHQEPPLRIALGFVLRHRLILGGFTLAGIILSALYALTLPPVYQSTATLLLEPARQLDTAGVNTSPRDLDLARVDSELVVIRSERLLLTVFNGLNLYGNRDVQTQSRGPMSGLSGLLQSLKLRLFSQKREAVARTNDIERQLAFANFAQHVSADRIGQSYVIAISYSSSDPAMAQKVTNAIVSAYLLQAIESKYRMAVAGAVALQGRIDALAGEVETATAALKSGTLPTQATPDADARVIGAPQLPLGPSAPRRNLIVALGAFIGLFAGIGAAVLKTSFDRRVGDWQELAQETGLPCLGIVQLPPMDGNFSAASPKDIVALFSEQQGSKYLSAIRDLRTAVDLATTQKDREGNTIIAIAGCDDTSAASTVCIGLAELVNRSGRHVTVMLENARGQHKISGFAATLADMIVNRTPFSDVVFRSNSQITVVPIHSNNAEANLYADFRSSFARRIMDTASQQGNVLIELPPLEHTADGLALAVQADAVIIVAIAGQTTRDDVIDVMQRYRHVGANVIGTVIGTTDMADAKA
ncbi:Wzz/FepE/Etk N-terminal domain-containing protein [Allorhizobium sp. BGMRC 0089]|uniref:Wzz/FepE/Etk N-terminal domain-containing protein n=1 Tax=Allorhizobium sonneratiae TaxID=2934936 RepID=UPI0020345A15|nr:Wzz/FepE/Etk N-terminal domain-containing protein [Allorhizobium sonneratiae]MCM2293291.1 Wzz/FepE/Etk N-terminal domain-containing protein [Allorhizobium sonneratiae]